VEILDSLLDLKRISLDRYQYVKAWLAENQAGGEQQTSS
jgi:hypothetical protein